MTGIDATFLEQVASLPLAYGGYSGVEMALWVLVFLSGLFGTVGAGYLLYVDTIVVHYTDFFKRIAFGLLIFVLTAPVVFFYATELIHAVHALAAAVISVGLYTLIRAVQQSGGYRESSRKTDADEDFEQTIPELTLDEDE